MSYAVENAIKEMMDKHAILCVRALADKYGFDPLEAMASLPRTGSISPEPISKKAATAAKKAAAAAKKAAKADKPKRAPTGYLMFCSAERPSIKQEYPDYKPQEIVRELGRRWKTALSEEERQEWNDYAKATCEPADEDGKDTDEDELELEEN